MRHQPRKRFGQNFLRDDGVIDDIERAINQRLTTTWLKLVPVKVLTQADDEWLLDAVNWIAI